MKSDGLFLRNAEEKDRGGIVSVIREAFGAEDAAGIVKLVERLLDEPAEPEILSCVAEKNGEIVGYIALSPVVLSDLRGSLAYILAPLAVVPGHQTQGVGGCLVDVGIEHLRAQGVDFVFVYGDPAYYGRFGFRAATARNVEPPYPLSFPLGWQATTLSKVPEIVSRTRLCCVPALCDSRLW